MHYFRVSISADDDLRWVAVSQAAPCPVCGATDGCGVARLDGEVVNCLRVVSQWPMKDGGWLHVPERTGGRT